MTDAFKIGVAAESRWRSYEFYFGKTPMTYNHASYANRVNILNLARQAPSVRDKARDILEEIRHLQQALYWSIDGDEDDGGAQWASSLIEHAHALIDLAHDYRHTLAANPPPQIPNPDETSCNPLDND